MSITVRQRSGWWVGVLILMLALLAARPAEAAPRTQGACEGDVIAGGCFFRQTTGGNGGYSVVDDSGARFWAEYRRLGGAQTVGYPISRRFVYDGFITQAFQKLVLQWRPEVGVAYPMNIFDELSEAGLDDRLFSVRQTPYPLVNFDPPGATWGQIVARRQALLNDNAAIQARYFSFSDPLNVFGLPFSRVEDMGNHWAVRTQRAVFQQWKETVPWAQAGQVTIANGGDIAKEMGWYNPEWLVAEGTPGVPLPQPSPTPASQAWVTKTLLVGNNNTMYALQLLPYTPVSYRIMVSRNGGTTWDFFGLPALEFPDSPHYDIAMDYRTTDGLIAVTDNHTVYAWTGSNWERRGDCGGCNTVVVSYANPQTLYAGGNAFGSECALMRSDDGGRTWQPTIPFTCSTHARTELYGIDPRPNGSIYLRLGVAFGSGGGSGYVGLTRHASDEDDTGDLVYEQSGQNLYFSMTIDGASGQVYLATGPGGREIWVLTNPDAPNGELVWAQPYTFAGSDVVRLLGSGTSNGGVVLYAVLGDSYETPRTYLRSFDGGVTWEAFNVPM